MRVRSLATVLGTSLLLAAAVLRCNVPPAPPPQQAIATKARRPVGAFVSIPPGGVLDRAGLVASLREMQLSLVVLQASADETAEVTMDRVALAVDLQRELDVDVLVGTYEASAHKLNGKPVGELLQKDATFDRCYAPNGPALGADLALIDKLRICSQDVAQKVADELTRVNASARIGCYVSQQPQLVDSLTAEEQTVLHAFLRDAAGPCVRSTRLVAVSPILAPGAKNPTAASVLLRDVLMGTGIGRTMLQDGVGTFDPTKPDRASSFYVSLRIALDDRADLPMQVWGNVTVRRWTS